MVVATCQHPPGQLSGQPYRRSEREILRVSQQPVIPILLLPRWCITGASCLELMLALSPPIGSFPFGRWGVFSLLTAPASVYL